MKNKYIIIIFVVGLIFTIFGALFKILHFEIGPLTGNYILTIGSFLEILSAIILIIKLFLIKKTIS